MINTKKWKVGKFKKKEIRNTGVTRRIFGEQDLFSDIRWSKMSTDGSSSALGPNLIAKTWASDLGLLCLKKIRCRCYIKILRTLNPTLLTAETIYSSLKCCSTQGCWEGFEDRVLYLVVVCLSCLNKAPGFLSTCKLHRDLETEQDTLWITSAFTLGHNLVSSSEEFVS